MMDRFICAVPFSFPNTNERGVFFVSKNKGRNRARSESLSNFSGQHLLINKHLIRDLIHMAGITSKDTVLDIGAGAGAITIPLASKAAKVLAIENDPAYAEKLSAKIKDAPNAAVKQIDILQLTLPNYPFLVVANIPFSITTPIFGKLLDQPSMLLQRAVLIVEMGAAKRFTADPITNPRILKWRMWYDIRLMRTVPSNNFSPPPRVDAAVVTVSRKNSPLIAPHHHAKFMALAAYGLKNPNAPLLAAFSGIFTPPQMTHVARRLKVDRNQPVCSLDEQQWAELFHAMLQHVEPHRWPKLPKASTMPKAPKAPKAPKVPKVRKRKQDRQRR